MNYFLNTNVAFVAPVTALGQGDVPLGEWLAHITRNLGVWDSKPAQTLCAGSMQHNEWVHRFLVHGSLCGARGRAPEKKGSDVGVDSSTHDL